MVSLGNQTFFCSFTKTALHQTREAIGRSNTNLLGTGMIQFNYNFRTKLELWHYLNRGGDIDQIYSNGH